MPETRHHRGPHPEDDRLFAADQWPQLLRAVTELSWLFSRGYAEPSALKLVGDRHNLTARQRIAVRRCSCSDAQVADRQRRQVDLHAVASAPVQIDGFNLITTVESALAGGVLLVGRDGCVRDMASMHGSYRKVHETRPAIELVGRTLAELRAQNVTWLLDQPVSNSGRLKAILLEMAGEYGWPWQVTVVPDPDVLLIATPALVVSADAAVVDQCGPWLNLARLVIEEHVPAAMFLDLGDDGSS